MTKEQWMEKNEFNPISECTFCIISGNTYDIKDELKKYGYIYSPILGWHCGNQLNLPQDYSQISINFDLVYEWDEVREMAFYKADAKQTMQNIMSRYAGPSLSEYIGQVGEELTCDRAIYTSSRGYYNKRQQYTYIHTFHKDNNILVWFTSKPLYIEKGSYISLKGTVKAHQEYHGEKTTILTRCRIQ